MSWRQESKRHLKHHNLSLIGWLTFRRMGYSGPCSLSIENANDINPLQLIYNIIVEQTTKTIEHEIDRLMLLSSSHTYSVN